jgi:hypothetical protein
MHVLLILNVYCQFTDPTGWNSGLVIDYYWNNMHKKQEKKQQRGIIQEWKNPGGGRGGRTGSYNFKPEWNSSTS